MRHTNRPAHPARRAALAALLLLAVPTASPSRLQATEVAAGAALYDERCSRCHGLIGASARAAPRPVPVVMLPLGPNLTGVYGRAAGTVPGYRYSDAFRAAAAAGLVWDDPTLERWLADSRAMIPGTYMLVKIAPAERDAIIAYLKASASR